MSEWLLMSKPAGGIPYCLLKEYLDWGLISVDVVGPPRRFWADTDAPGALVEVGLDRARLRRLPLPAQLLTALPEGDNWQSMSRRSIARLHAFFLVLEDPQRRLDVRAVETLAHQVSLVRHVLETERLNRVLIADEVGLGKTVEAGLIVKELLEQRPGLRVLYLAPARLVSNVRREFQRLDLSFRQWSATDADARLSDPMVIASIHRAVANGNFAKVVATAPWDVLVVDECHHLSAWSPDGTDASQAYKLVEKLVQDQPKDGRVILMSGTPHQGHGERFANLLLLLKNPADPLEKLAGRVIYRTKDDIVDWDGNPVFPRRQVNPPLIVDLGSAHRQWLKHIFEFYRPTVDRRAANDTRRRALGWRCAQAMQWATSSPLAGLGYLVRQAVRAKWTLDNRDLSEALKLLRPYRLGPRDEAVEILFGRIQREVARQQECGDVEDIESFVPGQTSDPESEMGLARLLREGIELVATAGDDKFNHIYRSLLADIGKEKVVLFAQPIETVTALARFLERETGEKPALILGGQNDAERRKSVEEFCRASGPQYLVSSRAGGEGINLQIARRLVHIDVPWNPMDMEQRVGRVHRFGSRRTVVVDTVVVKESREWEAYTVARERLALITSTLVEQERFESVFSRVMCLVAQDDFADVMINGFGSPLNRSDQARLADLVQQGFQKWRDFHDKYGREQASIRAQNPGLAGWEDLAYFAQNLAGAQRVADYEGERFVRRGQQVSPVAEESVVLRFGDGSAFVCADTGESRVYGPDGSILPKLGLNRQEVAEPLRRVAFPDAPTGAAFVRWAHGEPWPASLPPGPFGALAFSRQTIQPNGAGGWIERRNSLHIFVVTPEGPVELEGEDKGRFLRGLLRSTIRKSTEGTDTIVKALQVQEPLLIERLRRPSPEERGAQIRHGVLPLSAVVVTN